MASFATGVGVGVLIAGIGHSVYNYLRDSDLAKRVFEFGGHVKKITRDAWSKIKEKYRSVFRSDPSEHTGQTGNGQPVRQAEWDISSGTSGLSNNSVPNFSSASSTIIRNRILN